MLDSHDMDDGILLSQPVDDPVRPAARREVAGQLAPERLADTTRTLAKRPAAELPDGKGNGERQLLLESAPGGS